MGRNKRKRKRDDGPWEPYVLHSDKFLEYYKEQHIVPENEWESFVSILKTPLPTTFRITATTMFANTIKEQLQRLLPSENEITSEDGTVVETPRPINWYPDRGAWYFKVSKKDVKKLPQFEKFHKYLIAQTDMGNISRQESVSMIPPFLLQVQPHHKVLDMCAAPGSKTAQLVEFMHSADRSDQPIPPAGLVVGNDVDYSRCYMLVHQVKRLLSPCIVITNHEAQNFPFLKIVPKTEEEQHFEGRNNQGKVTYQFDRVLCDVPCTGDGTLRKNPEIWSKWTTANGIGMHRLQIKIAQRGANLLKVNGRMVYSTCSFNPIENEAIVAELLRRCKGSLRLVNVAAELPQLVRSPGLSSWKVQDRDGKWFERYDEVDNFRRGKILPSLFAPTKEEAEKFNLHYCMRILPHVGDTGGFFVAVLEKIAPTWERTEAKGSEEATGKSEETEEGAAGKDAPVKPNVAAKFFGKEAPFLPVTEDLKPVIDNIRQFYGLRDEFPVDHLMVRSSQPSKLYYVSRSTKQLFPEAGHTNLQIVNTGLKLFVKHDMKDLECAFRPSQEGLRWLYPFLTKRVIHINHKDFQILLNETDPFFHTFSPPTQQALFNMDAQGGIVFKLDNTCPMPWANMAVAGWRGKTSCHLLLSKMEIKGLLQLEKSLQLEPVETNIKEDGKAEQD